MGSPGSCGLPEGCSFLTAHWRICRVWFDVPLQSFVSPGTWFFSFKSALSLKLCKMDFAAG